ncbi:MAG TPA: protein kinase [Thermoanaerobaculia bacterium]|nr:protein kinase [Thermoanaerobaculia bacterium]
MTIASGSRLGPYEVLSPLGAGGMGEVWRARDAKLGRDVAIKVLPDAFITNAERLARFRREAKVLASLNHPHIAAIYGLEESGGVEALVLELVEGETLAERLVRGPLPVEEALEVARQVAEALEAAHERGIVHRDLKPANVKLTPGAQVKVLDFGLAKALSGDVSSPDISTSPTLTAEATQAGVALGTAAYMSPEQARGKPIDKRADVWAFGALLYEMLTERRAFTGETISDTLAAVLKTDPDWEALPPATPAAIRRLLRRCLQKDPSRRLRDVGDARIEIEEAAGEAPSNAARPAPASRRRLLAGLLAGFAIGAVAAGLIVFRLSHGPSGVPMRFVAVTNFSGMEIQPSLSPDGRSVAFVSNRDGVYDIWVGLVTGGRLVRITDDPNVESHPRWSPDGTTIAYARLKDSGFSDIWEVPALGGVSRRVVVDAIEPAWSPDGRSLAYSNPATGTIWSCDASGGNARAVTQQDPIYGSHRQPAFAHDGRRIVFVRRQGGRPGAVPGGGPYGELAVADLATGEVRVLTHDRALAYSPVWSPGDQFLYFASSRGGTINIWKMASDGGEPQQITAGQGDDADLSLSTDGKRLVFSTYRQNINIGMADLETKGQSAGLKWLTSDAARGELAPAFSPDGRRIAYFSNRKGAEREGIWVMDADGANAAPLVVDDYQNVFPRWYADGQALFFRSSDARLGRRGDRFRRVAISGGPPEVVLSEPLGLWVDVDSQGRILGTNAQGRGVIYDPKTKQKRVLEACAGSGFRWSPDGRRIAYIGPPGGLQAGLWVYDFQSAPRQVFSGWLVNFAWAGSEELIYEEGKPDLTALFWSVRPDGSARRRVLLSIRLGGSAWELSPTNIFDVSPDRRRIVIQAREQSEADIGMIENVR